VQLGSCDSGGDLLALGALSFGDYFGGPFGVAEGQQVRVQGNGTRRGVVERDAFAVDDDVDGLRTVAGRTVAVGAFAHGSRIGRSSSGLAVADDLGDVLRERPVRVVFADERDGEQLVVALEILEGDDLQAERDQAGVEGDCRASEVAVGV